MYKLVKNKDTEKCEHVKEMKNSYRFRTILVVDSIIDLLTTWKKVQFNKLQEINIFPTLARQSGISFEQISEALTHSDTTITKTYVNTPNVIKNARW